MLTKRAGTSIKLTETLFGRIARESKHVVSHLLLNEILIDFHCVNSIVKAQAKTRALINYYSRRARQSKARQSKARQGKARQSKAR